MAGLRIALLAGFLRLGQFRTGLLELSHGTAPLRVTRLALHSGRIDHLHQWPGNPWIELLRRSRHCEGYKGESNENDPHSSLP
ncbi:hypothetical protein ACLIBK_07980 [Roseomonas sp. BN140053]